MRLSRCSACPASIVWATNDKTLRTMPVDAEPTADGNVILTDNAHGGPPSAHVLTKAETSDPGLFPPDGPRHTSHFATCPNAADFRRKP